MASGPITPAGGEGEDRRSRTRLTRPSTTAADRSTRRKRTPPPGPRPPSGPRAGLGCLQPDEPNAQTAKEPPPPRPVRQPDADSSSSSPRQARGSTAAPGARGRRDAPRANAGTRRARGRRLRAEDAGVPGPLLDRPISPRRSARLDRTRNAPAHRGRSGAVRSPRSTPPARLRPEGEVQRRRATDRDGAVLPRSTWPSELAETGNSSGASAPFAGSRPAIRDRLRREHPATRLREVAQGASAICSHVVPSATSWPTRGRRDRREPRPRRAPAAATAPPGPRTARAGRVRVRRGSPADGR